jgi:hypothetical protein
MKVTSQIHGIIVEGGRKQIPIDIWEGGDLWDTNYGQRISNRYNSYYIMPRQLHHPLEWHWGRGYKE